MNCVVALITGLWSSINLQSSYYQGTLIPMAMLAAKLVAMRVGFFWLAQVDYATDVVVSRRDTLKNTPAGKEIPTDE